MKTNKICAWAAGIGLVIIALAMTDRACSSDKKIREAKAAYDELARIAEADHQMSLDRIGQMTKDIEQRDANILNLEESVTQKDAKITLLSRQLADIVGQEPPTTPEIESLPIVINLRAQVKTLNEMFTLATETIRDKDDIIREWEAKFNTQFKITMEWKAAYDREHTLRLEAEKLFGLSERRRASSKLESTVSKIVAGAAVVYAITK